MLGGTHTDLLVAVALLFLTGTQCRAEDDLLLVTLPERRADAEYVTQCFYGGNMNPVCDWARSQTTTAPENVLVSVLESGPLGLEGEACLEFWFLAPVAARGSELRVLLKTSVGLEEIWTSPALPKDAWRQVFLPLYITEPGTQVVFEAAQALSIDEQITFRQMGVRRGPCGHQCESNTDLWTDESTRCLCSVGQLLCFPTQCPTGQICGPQRNGSSGNHTSGMCTIHSHTDCSTFDGVLFRFMAPCTYVLAKTCSSTGDLPVFSVKVVNEQNGNASLPTVEQIIVDMGNVRVSLLKRQTQQAVVNGVWRKLPLSLSSGTIHIKSNPAAVVLGTSFGLSVSYDKAGDVHVYLPSKYSDKVCGLCGNFNQLREDDFRKADGTNAHNATDLAKSWQAGEATSSCETILVPHQCDPQEAAEHASDLYCGGLLSSTGPFADCLSVLGVESYFRGCVVGMCSTHGDPAVLCEAFDAFADICKEAGVAVPMWRNSTFCPLQCGENSHYNSCADGCPEVCSNLDLVGSCGTCEERCECNTGFKLSGEKCVPAEDCGCWHKGKHYEKGETVVEGDCLQWCRCMGSDAMQCTAMQCAGRDVCKVKDGVKGCFPFEPVICHVYGDPHYITFDNNAYDFQGGCSYTLTTTCTRESSVHFTVIGHNMHPPLQNFTRSKFEAVTLQVEDLYLTMNQSGEVYVHNSRVRLPYNTSGIYGSVWVHMTENYMILDTSFGLRIGIDGEHRMFLQVDERYRYELCGLCGTYSGQQDDDFITPDGKNAIEAFEFGDSWRVPDNNECVAHPNNARLCDNDELTEAKNQCSTLFGANFQNCHEHVHPSIYLSSCVSDYCATSGDQHTLCESLKSYAVACQVAGVELPNWQAGTACDFPNTEAPVTTPSSTSPTADQILCPMNCNFENNLCGWEQLIQDSFDWTRHSGPTPSNLTGPNQDHTTGAGFYMYLEGNSVTHGDSARLLSSVCHYDGPLCLQFWYHMYGSATAMALNIYLLKDNKATKRWSMMNNQGPEWHQGNVDIRVNGPFQIIVEGIRGANDQSDVAIDDMSIHFGTCSDISPGLVGRTELPPTTAEALPSHPVCNLDCSFDSNLCRWNQMITDAFDWTWRSGSTPTLMTGPSADHTGDGHYVYIEASSVTHGDTARLISTECSDSGPQCLQFWYHMYGSADTMGLHAYLVQNRVANAVWWKRNNQGDMWHLAQVDIEPAGTFQIIIEGRRGSNDESDVAIDDVKLYGGHCSDLSGVVTTQPAKPDLSTTAPPSVPVPTTAAPEPSTAESVTDLVTTEKGPDNTPPLHPVCQLHCSFEHDLCQWSQLLADVFDWTRHSGSTPTMITGPSSDHTTGDGHYLYIEGNSATLGDTARLISAECADSGPQCLQFWYHMYGSADTMGLHVYLIQDRKAEAVWRKRNEQGNMWHLAQVDLETTQPFQIIFEGRRGSNDQSDVAIDDVSLHRGHCADLTKPTIAASTTLDPTGTEGSVRPSTTSPTEPETTVTSEQPDESTKTSQTTVTSRPPTTTESATPSANTLTTLTTTPTTYDTQTTTTPTTTTVITTTSSSDLTTGSQVPITSRPTTTTGPQSTPGPEPQTTTQPETPPETTFTTFTTTVAPNDNDTKTTTEPATTVIPNTSIPDVPTTGPQNPITSRPTATTGPQTTLGPEPQTTTQPETASETTFTTFTTTVAPNDNDTKTTTEPATTVIPNTSIPDEPTTSPQNPITSRPTATTGPQTTHGPEPQTTTQPETPPETTFTTLTTTVAPNDNDTKTTTEPATTVIPNTSIPDVPTTRPQNPITSRPTATTGPQTTPGLEPQTTTQPETPSETTFTTFTTTVASTDNDTKTTTEPATTVIPNTSIPDVPTTGPQNPITSRPTATTGPQTTLGPEPQTTTQPETPPETTITTLTTTVAPNDNDTKTTTEPATTLIPDTSVPDEPTTKPQLPITSRPTATTATQTTPGPETPSESTFATFTTTVAPTDHDTQTTTEPATTVIPNTSIPDVPTTKPQNPITSRPTATTGPQTTPGLEPQTTTQPETPSETTFTTFTTTVASTDNDTKTTTEPATTVIPNTSIPDVPTTKPQNPITSRPTATTGPQTTLGPEPQTTTQPETPPETTITTLTTTVAPNDNDTKTTTEPATTVIPDTSVPDEPTTKPQLPITSRPTATTATQTTPGPEKPSESTFATFTTTVAPTDHDTQTTTEPATTVIPNTSIPDVHTTRPQNPITSRPTATTGPQTTHGPEPQTTTQPETPSEITFTTFTTTVAPIDNDTKTTKEPATTAIPNTSNPDVPTTRPQNPITSRPTATTSTQTTPGLEPQTTTQPETPSETTFTTFTTTVAPIDNDTKTTTEPATTAIPNTSNPDVPTTRPQNPITSRPTATTATQTTPGLEPQTTTQPETPSETTFTTLTTTVAPTDHNTQPVTEPTTTVIPDTSVPDVPTTRPQLPNTSRPTATAVTQTTPRPETPSETTFTTFTTTVAPTDHDTQTITEPTTTVIPDTSVPDIPTTRPQNPITSRPAATTGPQTTPGPEPQTTPGPEPQTTTQPETPTTTTFTTSTTTAVPTDHDTQTTTLPTTTVTVKPQPPTTVSPDSQTTNRPQPPTITTPKLPTTTITSEPPFTVKPHSTTTSPQQTTTARPMPATSTRPSTTTATPQPTTTPVPTPSCPENSHYNTCTSACSPTCTHLNGPPHCSDNEGCLPGCVCNNGFVWKGRACVPVHQCGCVDRDGNKHNFNDVWYTNHCSQKCECDKDDGMGKIDCDDEDECDGNSICLQNGDGNYYCQSTGFRECTIKGDPEYRTFDKMKHDFKGEHSYVLVRTTNLPNNIPDVYIEAINKRTVGDDDDDQEQSDSSSEEDHSHRVRDNDDDNDDDDDDDDDDKDNEDDDDSEEHENHHRLRELKIRVYNHTVELKRNRRLIVNGRRTNCPVSPTAGLKIREHSSRIYLKTDFGLSVEFDGRSSAEIILPRIYKRKVGGLCGNFDGHRSNDKMKPDGTRARSTQEFGESWRV
ncbi:zonadhesin-like [Mugil cephalus]|uniref:zonadhesin-like n=1 Tax=Mugil cephalus TaxID=48193 RepID=UPI001FB5E1C4|nr:zonadhesin-like [Mugil cephalus]